MTQAHPRLVHQSFVSLRKFDQSIKKVMDKTFSAVNFDRTKSLLPTYIGVEVDYEKDPENQKVIRRFFEALRRVHQNNFVRFVTDTLWAMESHNGDIFYCHDEDKDDRCDVQWTIKVVGLCQVQVTVLKTPDNSRRELLTELEANVDKLFKVVGDQDEDAQISQLLSAFYLNTKNIQSLKYFHEDCHVILTPSLDGTTYLPVILCGMSSGDMRRRWNGIKGQLMYQKHNYPDIFPSKPGVSDLLDDAVTLLQDNGLPKSKGFCPRVHYNNIELLLSIVDSATVISKSDHDVGIVHAFPHENETTLTVARYSIEDLIALH